MDILLYGLGRMTDSVANLLKKEHRIIGYTDSFSTVRYFHGKCFYQLNELNKLNFDYIIITIYDRRVAWKIMNTLITDYHIEKRKIIPFFVYAKSEIVENTSALDEELDGIILGNSHAHYGYLPDYLDGRFINLACPSQEIYYNYKVFQRYVEMHQNTIHKIKYIVFDFYDYNIFNSDISLTTGLFDYISWGGIIDRYHYDDNVHYHADFEEELFHQKCMLAKLTSDEKLSMEILFGTYINPEQNERQREVNERWEYITDNEPLTTKKFLGGNVIHRFEKTIIENIQIMEKFIEQVNEINPKCQIILTLMPRYITMEKTLAVFMKEWKQEFEKIIENLQKRYKIHFINYKDRIEISMNNRFYYDVNHLNTIGGRCITSILNEDIKKIMQDDIK